ncbi:type III secretion system protein, YscO family [Desulfosarcina variabilis str. Montpellier]|uniref:type III secretion system stalk subunit SctO n=1 Tax=Desulfosarcina variabilis TaxID=2300 RepID=UPI003AFB4A57
MTYILEDLLRIRKRREQSALNSIIQARKSLVEAKDAAKKKADQLSNFIQWRKNEEDRLFDEIQRKYNTIYQLIYYNQCVDSLRKEQNKLTDQLNQAKQNVVQADEAVKKSYEDYQLCHREKRKLEEHKEQWLMNKMTFDQHSEENKIDEINSMRFNAMRLL